MLDILSAAVLQYQKQQTSTRSSQQIPPEARQASTLQRLFDNHEERKSLTAIDPALSRVKLWTADEVILQVAGTRG
jgi:hypothetical protein